MDINNYSISLHLKIPGALTQELNRFLNSQPPDAGFDFAPNKLYI